MFYTIYQMLRPHFAIREKFSPSCTSVCDSETLDPRAKSACDEGSQQYCSNINNIITPECRTYTDRLVRSRASEKTSINYANKVIPPSSATIASYYSAIGDTAFDYITKNMPALNDSSIVNMMNIFKAEESADKPIYTNISEGVASRLIDSNPNRNAGLSVNWLTDYVANKLDADRQVMMNETITDIISKLVDKSSHINAFHDLYIPIFNLIESKLTIEDLSDPRVYSIPSLYLLSLIDRFFVSYVMGTQTELNDYSIDLSQKPKLYEAPVMRVYGIRSTMSKQDKLVLMIDAANLANFKFLSNMIDPTKDPLYIAMKVAGQAVPDKKYDEWCLMQPNFSSDECIQFMNTQIASGENVDSVYMNIIRLSTDSNGKIQKDILSKYAGITEWLYSKMDDKITVVDGKNVIVQTCGTPNNLTIDQCNQLCDIYPDLCLEDKIERCRLPEYRYQKEGFISGSCSTDWWIYFVIILFCVCVSFWMSKRLSFIKINRERNLFKSKNYDTDE